MHIRPDLVGLQEVLHNQLEDLLQRLPEFGYIGVGRRDGKTGGGNLSVLVLLRSFLLLIFHLFHVLS
jgi:hypothetical protein